MIDERFPVIDQGSFTAGDIIGQDTWVPWTPVRTGWTDVGTSTVTGRYHVIGRQCFFVVRVVPGTSVATTAGTSYIGLPLTASGIGGNGGSMENRTSNIAVGSCVLDSTNSRVYVPTQVATGNTLTISGWYEV